MEQPTQFRPLPSLNRMPSFAEKPTLVVKAPSLHPVALEPECSSTAAVPLAFLRTIARLEIHGVRERDGVTYYVLDVYLNRSTATTRLPTNLSKTRTQLSCTTRPDYQIERRFSEFRHLREQIFEAAAANMRFRCPHCNAFMSYLRLNMQQPSALVKLFGTAPEHRLAILPPFINELLTLARSKKCTEDDEIPHFLSAFLQKDGSAQL
ncbi:hypothetical protein FI667_g3500, partial [Globisporangium splendens]